MACVNCAKIRSLLLHGKMAEAAGLTVEALREKIGFGVAEPVSEPAPAPTELPSLSSKTKAELLEIAAAEGVEIAEGATNAQIVEAIEVHRRELVDA